MRIRDIFTVPEGEKVTEKAFCRVLISSACSILLCMGCLVGATWAWFAADIKSADNVIAIATVTADTAVTKDGNPVDAEQDGSYVLPAGEYAVQVSLDNNATDSQRTLYVLMTVKQEEKTQRYYLQFDKGVSDKDVDMTVTGTDATVAFKVSWSKPDAADLLDDAVTVVTEDEVEVTTTTTTAPITTTTTAPTTTTTETATTTTTTTTVDEATTTSTEAETTVTEEVTTTAEETTTEAEETTTVTEEVTTTTTVEEISE